MIWGTGTFGGETAAPRKVRLLVIYNLMGKQDLCHAAESRRQITSVQQNQFLKSNNSQAVSAGGEKKIILCTYSQPSLSTLRTPEECFAFPTPYFPRRLYHILRWLRLWDRWYGLSQDFPTQSLLSSPQGLLL